MGNILPILRVACYPFCDEIIHDDLFPADSADHRRRMEKICGKLYSPYFFILLKSVFLLIFRASATMVRL